MNRFEFAQPNTLDQALGLVAENAADTAVLAGGTDLLSLLKDFVVEPKRVVSILSIPELKGITAGADGLKIGAAATLDDLLESQDVAARWPLLVDAARGIRSPQLRTMGTVGGEVLQRPRCWYFRKGYGLLALKDGASMVEQGDNRNHAILDNQGPAKFVSASSLAPALLALGAEFDVASKAGGARTIPAAEFWRTPIGDAERENALAPGEILTAIRVRTAAPRGATYEVRHRAGLDWPEAAAACVLEQDDSGVKSARLALGHVAPRPIDASEAAKSLVGKRVDAASAAAVADAALASATPLSGNAHKVQLAKVAIQRALLIASGLVF